MECWPTACVLELVGGFVEVYSAASAHVHSVPNVCDILARIRVFGSTLSEHCVLLCCKLALPLLVRKLERASLRVLGTFAASVLSRFGF